MKKPRLWSQGAARRQLLGGETMNPSIAAKSLLGKERVVRATRKLKTYRRAFHKNNPLAALLGAAIPAPLGGLLKKSTIPERLAMNQHWVDSVMARDSFAQASANSLYNTGHATNRQPSYNSAPALVLKEQATDAAEKYDRLVAGGQIDATSGKVKAAGAAAPAGPVATFLGTPGGPQAAAAITRAVISGSRRRRPRYPSYLDRYGRQRYSYRDPAAGPFRLPAGAQPAPDSPYSFFRGAVGGGGALRTAGQFAVAGAAGVGAYLVTQRLLEYLGGRAQSKEEAGVNAAKALHQSLEDYKQQHGAYPPPAERQRMKEAYRQQLVELGYDPDTFTRTRGAVTEFLETYNPFGG